MREVLKRRPLLMLSLGVLALLVVKYFWTFFAFPGIPFGYDAGIYRFLFIREAAGWPPLFTPALPEWARSHAPGLFFLTSPFVKLGVPPDWFIGWIWNLVPVAAAVTLARAVRRTRGDLAGFFTLLCALLSVVQFQGFLMIYFKVFVAFIWCVLAFAAFEAGSPLTVLFGMLTVATHQQIGLIYGVAALSALASGFFLKADRRLLFRKARYFLASCVLGALWYIPTYQRSIGDVLPQLLHSGTLAVLLVALMAVGIFGALLVTLPRRDRRFLWALCIVLAVLLLVALPLVSDAPDLVVRALFLRTDTVSGAFLSITEYLQMSLPLLLLGVIGLAFSAEKERGSSWQWAAVWCAVASLGMFFFYRRFLLPLDFFLLPFAGLACASLWAKRQGRVIVSVLLAVQACFLVQQLAVADPHVKHAWLVEFASLANAVPPGSTVVVLDNMAPWVAGYLPDASVSGPGIFDSRPYEAWEKFLLGSEADRTAFISAYPKGTFFFASEVFASYYPPAVQSVLEHPCLAPAGPPGLYRSSCGS